MRTLLTASLILVALGSQAQFKTPESKFSFDLNYLPHANSVLPVPVTPPMAKFSFQNNFGKVYTLPKDNMPCLVPDMQKVIPIPTSKNYFENSLMLNPYKKEDIIPQQ